MPVGEGGNKANARRWRVKIVRCGGPPVQVRCRLDLVGSIGSGYGKAETMPSAGDWATAGPPVPHQAIQFTATGLASAS